MNATGPRLAIGADSYFYQRLKSGKSCFCSDTKRDFLHMDDFHTLMDMLIDQDLPTGTFNVSTGESHSILELFMSSQIIWISKIEKDPEVVPAGDDDVPEVVLDPTKTEEVIGWKPQVGFEQTINRMLSWYDKFGVSAIYSHLAVPKNFGS